MPKYCPGSVSREKQYEVKFSLGQPGALHAGSVLQVKMTANNYHFSKSDAVLKVLGER